jgi:hypothetical protein
MVMPLWSLGLARAGYWASDDAGHLAMTFRRGMEAYSRGDYEAALAPFDPAIEWTVDASLVLEATTDHGHAGVKRLWQTWAATEPVTKPSKPWACGSRGSPAPAPAEELEPQPGTSVDVRRSCPEALGVCLSLRAS